MDIDWLAADKPVKDKDDRKVRRRLQYFKALGAHTHTLWWRLFFRCWVDAVVMYICMYVQARRPESRPAIYSPAIRARVHYSLRMPPRFRFGLCLNMHRA